MKKLVLFCTILLGAILGLNAQVTDKEIADYHFNQGRYAEAKLYYDKLYETTPEQVYTNYFKCLVALKEFETAEQILKKRIKNKSTEISSLVQLGNLYVIQDRKEEAAKQFEIAIDKVDPARAFIQRLANELSQIQQYHYVIMAYEKGKKKGKDGYAYNYEIANTKGQMGDMNGMIDAFLVLLLEEPHYLSTVETSLARLIKFEDHPDQSEMLRVAILKKLQTNPDNITLAEIMTWFCIQTKNYPCALQQCIAIDKRLKEDGQRLIELANLCLEDNAFKSAADCYDYIISKGQNNSPYFYSAKMGILQTRLKEYNSTNTTQEQWSGLGTQYQSTLSQIPINDETLPIIENFIQIIGYRLQMADSAQRTVSNYLEKYNFSPKVRAKLKIILGDLNIIQNQIWEASLLYSQVELEFKEDVLGNEAKFKNAKVSFYAGDFAWAQSQLDALKGSTSKLVSNDAIDLSVLILESIPDSIEIPLEIYARAELQAKQYQYATTFTTLDSIAKEFPGHPLIDEALFLKATMAYNQLDWASCEKYLKEIIEFHFTELKYDDAMMMMGQLNEYHLNNNEEAMKWYEKILTEQPGSLLVTEARKSYRRLRGDQMQ